MALKNVLSYRSGHQKSKMVSRCQKPRCQQAVFLPRALGRLQFPASPFLEAAFVPGPVVLPMPSNSAVQRLLFSGSGLRLCLPLLQTKQCCLHGREPPGGDPPPLSQLLKATRQPLISHLNSTCNLRSPLPWNLA